MPGVLRTCTFVFMRHDAHRTPVHCLYDGTLKVLTRGNKFFALDIRGRTNTVSIDQLKPAFVDAAFELTSNPATTLQTRTRPPSRFSPTGHFDYIADDAGVRTDNRPTNDALRPPCSDTGPISVLTPKLGGGLVVVTAQPSEHWERIRYAPPTPILSYID